MDNGQFTVNYRLKDIIAKTGDIIGSAQDTQTNLTALAKLDTGRTGARTREFR